MCFPTFTALGSLFLLFSFILELFIMIGNLANSAFLIQIYFVKAWNKQQNLSYTFGLWNYCTGDGNGVISSCGSHTAAFDWASTPTISDVATSAANSAVVRGLFMGMFILFFIGCGFSFIFWLLSLPICCLKHRGWGYSMSILVFINFLVMLVALILALITVLSSIKAITGPDQGWNAHAGNALWLTIGSVISLFIALMCYAGGSFCCRRRNNRGAVDPNYNDKYNTNPNATPYMSSPIFVPHSQQVGANNTATGYNTTNQPGQTMLQQPYMVSPSVNNQQLSPGIDHTLAGHHQQQLNTGMGQTVTGNNQNLNTGIDHTVAGQQQQDYDPNAAAVPMHGYQTPILQPANTSH